MTPPASMTARRELGAGGRTRIIPEPVISPEAGIRESWAMPHQLGLPVFHFHASAGASRRLAAEA
jgi:hypothetical protein